MAASGGGIGVEKARAVTLVLYAATSYGGKDQAAECEARRTALGRDEIRGRAAGAYRRLSPPVPADGPGPGRARPVRCSDRRTARGDEERRDGSATDRPVFPVWPVPAAFEFAPGDAAGESARDLGGGSASAVGSGLPRQHQYPDELLAGGSVQPFGVRASRCSTSPKS